MSPRGTIPPSDMDPRHDDSTAGVPPARHPGAPEGGLDENVPADIEAPPPEA